MLRLGYNTSAFAQKKDITDIVGIIHGLGYDGMELTLDQRHFHPFFSDKYATRTLVQSLYAHNLEVVLNTGGRYALSGIAHEPSLVSASAAARERSARFVAETIQLAPSLGVRTVMLHSGTLPAGVEQSEAWDWLVYEVTCLAEIAASEGVTLGFEFHPSMFVASLSDYRFLKARVGSAALKLTLDVGHVVCTDKRPVSQVIAECNGEIANVHLEDIMDRKHVHLPIGQGDIDFADVFRGLNAVGYEGLINAEFNTDDLEVDECQLARETFEHLQRLM
ncbi:MAG: sugar phosphate isomerase/epimerase family protein [Anaerolineales bacterium]|jgi:sugar phosphate isomerase/epimerase|nr:sugar phosphate isomerase/epimerase family protein [Anaerolineales bacterium]|tara:strand:+ start:5901 stop:6734 length:834 start_codon:yes stop_codon:yes gene_type:complete